MSDHISPQLDWEEVLLRPITSVLALGAFTMDDGSARWGAVAICLDNAAIVVTVEPDTDQVIVARADLPIAADWVSIPSFDYAIGKKLGWCWIGINSQGYKDSFTVAICGSSSGFIEPHWTFVAVASCVQCFDLTIRRA